MKEAEGPRPCTYCPEPGADVCVRMASNTTEDVFAHEACGRDHGLAPIYRLTGPRSPRLGAEHFG